MWKMWVVECRFRKARPVLATYDRRERALSWVITYLRQVYYYPFLSRKRGFRARRREDEAIVALKVEPNVLPAVSALGWLAKSDHGDKEAIARALTDIVERA